MSLIKRGESLLLVIDAQENFYPPSRFDVDDYVLGAAFDRVAWLVAAANALDVPVIATEEEPEENGETVARIKNQLPSTAQTLPKRYFAAPDNPDILAAIESSDKPTVVVVGLETDICVTHTALQLQDLGKRVVVAHDCLYSPGYAHTDGLRRLENSGVDVLSAKGVFYDWIRDIETLNKVVDGNKFLQRTPGFHF